ncbi:Na-translocating system protein MpsC family protein [Virgibacillus profundi]|uniref:Na-translocating system protein MpsC family protein n=1 Tax=Virgibacillus profundi TaxID=2024555 RepID=UPI001F0ADD8C|nr:Na-translocating system protein MpsC family protein [Virgibacillus profundi]
MNVAFSSTDTRVLKKTIAQVYNRINQEFYATGVVSQRINVFSDRIIIFAQHKRIPAFTALSKNFKELTTYADAALISEFKSKLKQEIEEVTGHRAISVLKDYDTVTEHACCVVIFDKENSPIDVPVRE